MITITADCTPYMKIALFTLLATMCAGVVHKRFEREDHGLGKLKSLLRHFHEEYDHPMTMRVELLDDKKYFQREARKKEIASYIIE